MRIFTFVGTLRKYVRIRIIATVVVLIGLFAVTAIALMHLQPIELTDSPETVYVFDKEDKRVVFFGSITPAGNEFGDKLFAIITIWVDTTKVNKDRVVIGSISLKPYTEEGELERRMDQFGDTARIIYSVELRCLTGKCLNEDGTPKTPALKRMYVHYEMWERYVSGSPRVGVAGGAWTPSAIVGRVNPEMLDSYVFDGNTTPLGLKLGVSAKMQSLVVLFGAALIGSAFVFLLNPQIRLWPEYEEPQVAIARLKRASENRQESEYDRLRDAIEAAQAVRGTASADMYHLALALEEVGETDLAKRARRLHFVPGRGEALRREMLDDISRILGEGAHG